MRTSVSPPPSSSSRAACEATRPGERSPTSRNTPASIASRGRSPRFAGCSRPCPAMIFDDHDVHDDWNMSWRWVQEMRSKPWWEARIVGAFMSYWIYQHLGNLSPRARGRTMFQLVQEDEDAGPGSAVRRDVRPRVRFMPVGVLSRLRQHPLACRRLAGGARAGRRQTGDGRRARSGTGSSITRPAPSTMSSSRARSRSSFLTGFTTSRRGTRRSATAAGVGWSRRSASDSDARSTSSTGRPSTSPSSAYVPGCAPFARAQGDLAARHDPATRRRRPPHTSARSSSTRTRAAASTSSCARHSGTLYLQGARIVRVTGSRAAGVVFAAPPGWPAFPSHQQAGACPQSDVRQLDRRARCSKGALPA